MKRGERLIFFENVPGSAIRYRNFAGREQRFNKLGYRNFCLFLTPEDADMLKSEGFNVKFRPAPDDESDPIPYIAIKINFNSKRPPQINQVTQRGVTHLNEESVQNLDWAEIIEANISLAPYQHDPDSNKTLYLNELLVVVEDEPFLSQYMYDHFDRKAED